MKLYLDLDDTVFDTENYLRTLLGGSWRRYEGLIYEAYDDMSVVEVIKCTNAFSDYSKIPLIKNSLSSINKLKDHYDIVFCSSYYLKSEKSAKLKIAKKLGIPIILCGGDNWDKSHINMSDGVYIDDNTRLLNLSNAKKKICFYKKGNFIEKFEGSIVFEWDDLLELLLNLNIKQ